MRLKYKYVIKKLTNAKNIQSKNYLKTLLTIMDSINPILKSKTKKSISNKSNKRKTQRSISLD